MFLHQGNIHFVLLRIYFGCFKEILPLLWGNHMWDVAVYGWLASTSSPPWWSGCVRHMRGRFGHAYERLLDVALGCGAAVQGPNNVLRYWLSEGLATAAHAWW